MKLWLLRVPDPILTDNLRTDKVTRVMTIFGVDLAPGIGTGEACVWSDESQPLGNWSPYFARANTNATGQKSIS